MFIFDMLRSMRAFRARIRNVETARAKRQARKELRAYIKSLNEREYTIHERELDLELKAKSLQHRIDSIESILTEARETHHRISTAHAMMTRIYSQSMGAVDHVHAVDKRATLLRMER